MRNLKKVPVLKIIGIVWIVFSTLYVFYGEYGRIKVLVAQRAYNTGIRDSIVQLLDQSKSCQPIPVTNGDQRVELISLDCLKNSADDANSGQ